MSRYVDVEITRQTKPLSEVGYGTLLILATSKALAYKEYEELDSLKADFAVDTDEYKLAKAHLDQDPKPLRVAVYGVVYDALAQEPTVLTGALDTLIKTHNDFYYLSSVEQGDEEITALAKWIHKKDKMYITSTSNELLPGILKAESEANEELYPGDNLYENVFIMVHDQPTTFPAEALVGAISSMPFGSYTWTFKFLRGVPVVVYDDDKINKIHENNACTYIKEGGQNITSKGITVFGEYADVIQATHFLKSELALGVFKLLASNPKIPYTNGGIALVAAEVERVLNQGFKQGIIADEEGVPLYSISVPTRSDVPVNMRANRILPDVKWKATIAGAIEGVEIHGVLAL
ncbi:hypothetical protein AMS60_05620 [Bacillus sp. FJAT-21945]|nr:hypothetical protein AMS60_05620 [Bacillus sp. FJAT-21945]